MAWRLLALHWSLVGWINYIWYDDPLIDWEEYVMMIYIFKWMQTWSWYPIDIAIPTSMQICNLLKDCSDDDDDDDDALLLLLLLLLLLETEASQWLFRCIGTVQSPYLFVRILVWIYGLWPADWNGCEAPELGSFQIFKGITHVWNLTKKFNIVQ